MAMVRPRVPFRDVAWMWRSQGTQRSSLSWRVDWRETSESDAETMRKCTPEEFKPECPNAPAMVLYPVHWAEMELCSQNSSLRAVPCWCQPWGDFCTKSGRRKWSNSTTLFVVSLAAGTLPCRFKPPLGWDGSAPDLSFPSSRHSVTSASLSPGQSAYQLQVWRHQLSLQVTPWGTKPGSDEEDASSSSPRLVPAFLTSWCPSFPFQPPIWPTPVNSGWTADRNNRPHRPLPSYHPCGNSPLHNKSVCLAHTSCPGQALADIASTVMDQLLLCAKVVPSQNQVHLPDMRQGKCWHAKVYSKACIHKAVKWGDPRTLLMCLSEGEGFRVLKG